MKKLLFATLTLFTMLPSFAQNYRYTLGEELKLKKGTTDLDIVAADNTGLYFTETRLRMKSYFLIGASFTDDHKLYKVDKNFGEVFDKEYKKELKGLDFNSFQTLGNDLYLFATDYIKKERAFKVYGAKIDKNSGDLMGDFTELGSYNLESKKDDYEMKMTPVLGGKNFLLVSNISGKDRITLGVDLLDKTFRKKESAVINLEFDDDHFSLQDVVYTNTNKIVILGKVYEDVQVGKRKRKRSVFKQYIMMIYDNKGVKDKDVVLDTDNRFVISGKLIEQNSGDLLLAGFYSNTAKKDALSGFFINKVDPVNGVLTLSSFKEIGPEMLGKNYSDEADDEDDDTKESKKQAAKAASNDDEDDFPNSFIIKSVDINPVDNSIVITSEVSQYSYYTYTTSSYNPTTRSYTNTTYHVHRFTNQDVLVIDADKDGGIRWINALAKSQLEEVRTSSSSTSSFSSWSSYGYDYSGYFARGGGMPYYSSYASMISGNNLILLLNDHTSNNVNPNYGDRVKRVINFRKRSNAYGVSIDLATGKMTRKFIASNNDETILMPRHAMVVGNDFFVPSWRQHALAKTELRFAKITVR